jgi:lactoylglutathione lyase
MTSVEGVAAIRELVPLLFVQDITASVAFYVDQLGFTLAAKWEPNGKLAWCRVARDGSAIMLQQAEDEDGPAEGRGRGIGFYFNCDSVDAIYAEFSGRGLVLKQPKVTYYGEKQINLRDPDGYSLCFQSSVKGK